MIYINIGLRKTEVYKMEVTAATEGEYWSFGKEFLFMYNKNCSKQIFTTVLDKAKESVKQHLMWTELELEAVDHQFDFQITHSFQLCEESYLISQHQFFYLVKKRKIVLCMCRLGDGMS